MDSWDVSFGYSLYVILLISSTRSSTLPQPPHPPPPGSSSSLVHVYRISFAFRSSPYSIKCPEFYSDDINLNELVVKRSSQIYAAIQKYSVCVVWQAVGSAALQRLVIEPVCVRVFAFWWPPNAKRPLNSWKRKQHFLWWSGALDWCRYKGCVKKICFRLVIGKLQFASTLVVSVHHICVVISGAISISHSARCMAREYSLHVVECDWRRRSGWMKTEISKVMKKQPK